MNGISTSITANFITIQEEGAFLGKAYVHVPTLETLVKIQGTIDHPVSHVYFKGISFQYTNWIRPSTSGHVPLQAGMYLLDAYKLKVPGTPDKKALENQAWIGRPPAAVEVSYAIIRVSRIVALNISPLQDWITSKEPAMIQ
jgi:hypothetical protein